MRILLVAALASWCGAQAGRASPAPSAAPCPDTEREFVELTLARLVRQGLIDPRNLISYRMPKPPDACAAAPSAAVRAPASGLAGGP